MTELGDKIDNLLETIVQIVEDTSVPWVTKRDAILRMATNDRVLVALEEFCSWFAEE